MGVAYVGLVYRDPYECKVKGFRAVSSIERNVSNRRHLQGVRQAHLPTISTASPLFSFAEGAFFATAEGIEFLVFLEVGLRLAPLKRGRCRFSWSSDADCPMEGLRTICRF